jgi:uncharacterized protein with HEPN domain
LREAKLYLLDIKNAIRKIQKYVADVSYEQFSQNDEKIDAVIRNLEIIGEAARCIPQRIKQKYSGINWQDIAGMRNIIAHEYFGVDLAIIWKTIKENLPELGNKIEQIIVELDKK